jgi:probable HAF family extracellular repeat protein
MKKAEETQREIQTLDVTNCNHVVRCVGGPALLAAQQDDQSRQLPQYKLAVLPTLGGTFGNAWGVNNRGWLAGHSTLPGDQVYHEFLWRSGVITDLGTLGGPNSNNGTLNDRGAVSGFSDTSTPDPNGEDFCGF